MKGELNEEENGSFLPPCALVFLRTTMALKGEW
jgi:hypothetical protein